MASQSLRPPLRASNVNVFSRRIKSNIVSGLALLATMIVIAPLIAILFYLLKQGISSLNWHFFTKIPVPAGESGGGMANAIVGSGVVLALASLIGIPLGIGAGIYLAEYGRKYSHGQRGALYGRCAEWRSVDRHGYRNLFADSVAAEALLRPCRRRRAGHHDDPHRDPHHRRDAAHGAPRDSRGRAWTRRATWRTVLSITLRTASAGIVTGCMLAFARVAGETAPLLFTAFGNHF